MRARPTRYRVALLLALAGVGLSAYIHLVDARLHAGSGYTSFGNSGPTVNCDAVIGSRYSHLLGVGDETLGLAAFATGALLALPGALGATSPPLLDVALLGLAARSLGFALALLAIQLFALRTLCLLCLGVDAVALGWFLAALPLAAGLVPPWPVRSRVVVVGALVIALGAGAGAAMRGGARALTLAEVQASDPRFYDLYLKLPVRPSPRSSAARSTPRATPTRPSPSSSSRTSNARPAPRPSGISRTCCARATTCASSSATFRSTPRATRRCRIAPRIRMPAVRRLRRSAPASSTASGSTTTRSSRTSARSIATASSAPRATLRWTFQRSAPASTRRRPARASRATSPPASASASLRRRRCSSTGARWTGRSSARITTTRSPSKSTRGRPRPPATGAEAGLGGEMELSEDLKYRLAFLTMRLVFDRKLSAGDPGRYPAMLEFLDRIAGTQLAGDAGGKRYASQREKLESFIDAEFDEATLDLVNRVVAELV